MAHDANVASYAHRVIFLQDGVIQDELILRNKNLSAKEKVTKITERVEGISL